MASNKQIATVAALRHAIEKNAAKLSFLLFPIAHLIVEEIASRNHRGSIVVCTEVQSVLPNLFLVIGLNRERKFSVRVQ